MTISPFGDAGQEQSGRPDAFRALWDNGFPRLVPVVPPDAVISQRSTIAKRPGARGKAVGVKGQDGEWRGFNWIPYEADEADLVRWAGMQAGVGMKTGQQADGTWLVGIDADTTNEDHAKVIRQAVHELFGQLPIRIGRSPKALYVARLSGPLPYTRIDFDDGADRKAADGQPLLARVEILSDGKQFVASGVHPDTGRPYHWTVPLRPFAELPIVDPAKIARLLEGLQPCLPAATPIIREGSTTSVPQERLRGDLELIRRAVALTPNTSALFPTRESYRDWGFAIKAALPGHPEEAFDIYAEWCGRWADGVNDPDVVEADWRRMKPPFRRGASWIYEVAERCSGGRFSRAEVWFEAPTEELFPAPAAETAVARRRFHLLPIAEAAARALKESAAPLIKGLLDQGTVSVVYGPSNSGKSFLALSMAYHIARGLPWAGMRCAQAGVVYVAAEGGRGILKRTAALVREHGDAPGFYIISTHVDLYDAGADLQPLIEEIQAAGQPIGFIVLDTLARVMAGGDENSTKDMGLLVRHVDALRTATGTHVQLVHHSGKDETRGARGSSALRAAVDTEIEIAARTPEGDGRLSVMKQRDLSKNIELAFRLNVIDIGHNSEGERETSCIVHVSAEPVGRAGPKGAAGDVFAAVEALTADDPDREFKPADVADVLGGQRTEGAVRKQLEALAKKGFVRRSRPGFWGLCARPETAAERHYEPLPPFPDLFD